MQARRRALDCVGERRRFGGRDLIFAYPWRLGAPRVQRRQCGIVPSLVPREQLARALAVEHRGDEDRGIAAPRRGVLRRWPASRLRRGFLLNLDRGNVASIQPHNARLEGASIVARYSGSRSYGATRWRWARSTSLSGDPRRVTALMPISKDVLKVGRGASACCARRGVGALARRGAGRRPLDHRVGRSPGRRQIYGYRVVSLYTGSFALLDGGVASRAADMVSLVVRQTRCGGDAEERAGE